VDNLSFSKLLDSAAHEDSEWYPGFEGDRRIVSFQLGPFRRNFSRPRNFSKRFYHRVYDLSIEDWGINWDISILSGFCLIHSELSVRFQATVEYAKENIDRLPDINRHIKMRFGGLLKDATENELRKVEDVELMSTGLEQIEANIETLVNETLVAQGIQCRTQCRLDPSFKEIPADSPVISTGHFQHDQTMIQFSRRNYELQNQRDKERYRHEREEESLRLDHQEKVIQQSNRERELEKRRESELTERIKMELAENESREAERQRSEAQLFADQLTHTNRLKELEIEAELLEKKQLSKSSDEVESYVRRDIELLVLKKQHAILKQEIEKIASKVRFGFKKRKSTLAPDDKNVSYKLPNPGSDHDDR